MLISELEAELERAKAIHGDIEVSAMDQCDPPDPSVVTGVEVLRDYAWNQKGTYTLFIRA